MAILVNFLFQTCQKQGHRNQQNLKNRLQGTSPHGTSLIGQVLRVSSTSPMHKSNAPRTISWVALSLNVKWTDSDTSMNAAKQVKIWCTKLSVMTGRLIVVCAKILLTEKETSFPLPAKPWIALTKVSWLLWGWRFTLSRKFWGTSTRVLGWRRILTLVKVAKRGRPSSKSPMTFTCQPWFVTTCDVRMVKECASSKWEANLSFQVTNFGTTSVAVEAPAQVTILALALLTVILIQSFSGTLKWEPLVESLALNGQLIT